MIDNKTQNGLHWPLSFPGPDKSNKHQFYMLLFLRTKGETHLGLTCELSIFEESNS